MIITFENGAGKERRSEIVLAALRLLPGAALRRRGRGLELRVARPEKLADAAPALENLPGVEKVSFSECELSPLACAGGDRRFSNPLDFRRGPVLIAGPCAVEDEASYLGAAAALEEAGAHALRAAIFKPRSSPYAFQGIGWPGLRIIAKAKKLTGLPLVTEATDTRQVARLTEVCDVLQIGARNMRNYELLKEAAGSGRAVLLKRGMRATLREWLLSAEYLLSRGAKKIVLCERGDSSGDGSAMDMGLIRKARKITGLPVIADPSHASGDRRLAAELALRALRAGADGLMMEASQDPFSAKVDGRQTVGVETFRTIAAAACAKNRR